MFRNHFKACGCISPFVNLWKTFAWKIQSFECIENICSYTKFKDFCEHLSADSKMKTVWKINTQSSHAMCDTELHTDTHI